ncbi:hypothetical protein D9611_000156 [Ephemerocybe angulata]|uniref:Uncharacterized protein n=1 Tax=Ephemerocybe angulata TaxID=980116 RepID=A0A8H5BNI7_9AGAR|nr:hypothetical protein D9611_000156 [Tulosesus angulatus]
MLAARNAVACCSRAARRSASTSSHHAEPHAYEGFATPFWRNVVLAGLAGAAFYKFAPKASDSVYLTRWIAMYTESSNYWLDRNAEHTAGSQTASEDTLLFKEAKPALQRRLRYPMVFEQRSPFLHGVGATVDIRDVVVKSDGDL